MSASESIKEKNLNDLAQYTRKLWEKPKLRYMFFELTDKCNLACKHCGSRCTSANKTYLSLEAIKKTLCSVYTAYGTEDIMICLTGGEPLLYPDLYDVIRMAKDMGFAVGITTNGTLISKKKAEMLAEAGLDTIAVSIDGMEDAHDLFRNSLGSFQRTIIGIANLKEVGINPQIISVIHKENYDELQEMYDFFVAEDIYSWRIVSVDPIGRAKVNNHLLLDDVQLKGLLDFIRDKRFNSDSDMEATYGCSHFLTYEYENEVRDYYFQCGAGTMVASVMANGDIGACLDIERRPELIQGNIYKDDFVDIWENGFSAFRQDRTCKSEVCRECKSKHICMGDSFHTWDFENRKPLYCVADMLNEESK